MQSDENLEKGNSAVKIKRGKQAQKERDSQALELDIKLLQLHLVTRLQLQEEGKQSQSPLQCNYKTCIMRELKSHCYTACGGGRGAAAAAQ